MTPQERARAVMDDPEPFIAYEGQRLVTRQYIEEHLEKHIAAAIVQAEADARQEERERCAKVAEEYRIDDCWLGDPKLGLSDNARKIAAAIRALE